MLCPACESILTALRCTIRPVSVRLTAHHVLIDVPLHFIPPTISEAPLSDLRLVHSARHPWGLVGGDEAENHELPTSPYYLSRSQIPGHCSTIESGDGTVLFIPPSLEPVEGALASSGPFIAFGCKTGQTVILRINI